MSAARLREAAGLMRERAEAATGDQWAEWHMLDDGRAEVFVPNGTMDTETVFEFKDHMDCEECARPSEADVLHIASWHPTVALAVADWLDHAADIWSDDDDEVKVCDCPYCQGMPLALVVADAYLGSADV